MKKIVYGAIVALCGLFIAPDVEAQAGMAGSAKETVAQDKFYPIEGCMVKSVEVSNNSTFVKYKVVLLSRNGKIYKVYFDDRGHVVKEHAYFE